MNKKQSFSEALLAAGVVFNKDVNEFLIRVYMDALAPYDLETCAGVIQRLIKTSRFMPKPADILECLEGGVHGRAIAAWPEVERLATNSAEAKSADPITDVIVAEMGGWQRFGHAEYREYPFLQKEFVDRYETYLTSPKLLEQATQNQISGTRRGELVSINRLLTDE